MRRLLFAALMCGGMATPSLAQQVPARDLLDFPIGSIAEPAALSVLLSSGLWNPAAVAMPAGERVQLGIVALNSPIEQGVSAQLGAVSIALPRAFVLTTSLLKATITDLVPTQTDPQSLGGEIPYGTTVFSAGLSRRFGGLVAGAEARVRTGTVDYIQRSAFSLDWGVVADSLFRTPVRLAASTFLLSPTPSRERATILGAADVPVARRGSLFEVRAGVAASASDGRGHEDYFYGTVRYAALEARGGLARTHEFGTTSNHLRLGLDLRYGRYAVGIAREQEGAGLGAVYQFMLTSVFR
ncbi:MAG: hypothetical protein KGL38_02700 [Gemmatimonadota bacterium]|nr:hypothetical protein [Gemmatimonadota bacterium]MDE3171837.1 hypothetical protein [Gemmatimonadota bacterium]